MASKITIPDLKKIRVTDPLFSHYAGMVAKKMIPVQWEILNGKQGQSRCFCIDNFRIAGGTLQGEHRGVVFGDTDAYKWLEAVAYCANNGETEYISQADELIEIIGQALILFHNVRDQAQIPLDQNVSGFCIAPLIRIQTAFFFLCRQWF